MMNGPLFLAGFMAISVWCTCAQHTVPVLPATDPNPSAPAVSPHTTGLSNQTVQVLSKFRQVEASAVKLKFGKSMTGAFEIDLTGVGDPRHEAQLLSSNLGFTASVILDEAAYDGQNRTNFVFRGGSHHMAIMPIVQGQLQPGAKRMYVWPSNAQPAPAANLRIVPGQKPQPASK